MGHIPAVPVSPQPARLAPASSVARGGPVRQVGEDHQLAHHGHLRHLPGLPGPQEPLVERREVRVPLRRGPRAHEQGPAHDPAPALDLAPSPAVAGVARHGRHAGQAGGRLGEGADPACESAHEGPITCNAISPGAVETRPYAQTGELRSSPRRRQFAGGLDLQRRAHARQHHGVDLVGLRQHPAGARELRARRGFTRSASSSALNSAASRSRWYDEVASYTTPTTSGPAQRTSARIPRPSFANRRESVQVLPGDDPNDVMIRHAFLPPSLVFGKQERGRWRPISPTVPQGTSTANSGSGPRSLAGPRQGMGVCAVEIRGCHKTAGAVLHARAQRDAPAGPRTGCVRFNSLSSPPFAPPFR